MSGQSPDVILFDGYGNPLAASNGYPAPVSGIMIGGYDGTNLRYISTTTSGQSIIVGAGIAGTPSGGVVSVQGVSGGTAITISGTVTANQGGTWTVQPGNTPNTTPWLVVADGYVTTSAPAYANNTTNYLSLDTSGNLRVNISAQSLGDVNVNLAQVAGGTTATSATGVQKVGIVGNAGATLDATLAAGAAPTDGLGILIQYNTTQPAPTNTQTVSAQSDQSGNVLEFPGVQIKTGSAWTSSTAVNTLQYATGTTTIGAPLGGEAILIQLDQTTTLTGGAVTFQGTYDGTNWVTIPACQVLNAQTFVQLTNPYTFVASTNQPFLILLQGFQQIRLNLTTVITGTGSVTPYWTMLANSPISVFTQSLATIPSTYSSSFRSITPAATATDIFTITGSATKTIRVIRMNFSAIQTTAASQELLLIYRTTANTGGTSTTGTNVPWDPNNAAGTATVRSYTANPTALGTSAGNLQIIKYFINEGGSGSPEDYTIDFTHNGVEPGIVLRGTGDTLALNWNGAAVPAGLNVDFFVVWNEE